jgi:hypothetical protein
VREATSEAEARVALKRPMATVVKVRMLTVNEVNGRAWVKALGRRRFPSNDRSIDLWWGRRDGRVQEQIAVQN